MKLNPAQTKTLIYKIEDLNSRYDVEYDLPRFIRMTRKMNIIPDEEIVPFNLIFTEIEYIEDTLKAKQDEYTF